MDIKILNGTETIKYTNTLHVLADSRNSHEIINEQGIFCIDKQKIHLLFADFYRDYEVIKNKEDAKDTEHSLVEIRNYLDHHDIFIGVVDWRNYGKGHKSVHSD